MHKLLRIFILLIVGGMCYSPEAVAQRRTRPGSMQHSSSEVINKKKITKVKCQYVKDGAIFAGPIYLTFDVGGGTKIGDGVIAFNKGRYMLSFEAEKFRVKNEKYRNVWEYQKLGQDFDYGGKYETIEQYSQIWLILYDGDSENEFARIPIDNLNSDSFELRQDNMLIRMSYVK